MQLTTEQKLNIAKLFCVLLDKRVTGYIAANNINMNALSADKQNYVRAEAMREFYEKRKEIENDVTLNSSYVSKVRRGQWLMKEEYDQRRFAGLASRLGYHGLISDASEKVWQQLFADAGLDWQEATPTTPEPTPHASETSQLSEPEVLPDTETAVVEDDPPQWLAKVRPHKEAVGRYLATKIEPRVKAHAEKIALERLGKPLEKVKHPRLTIIIDSGRVALGRNLGWNGTGLRLLEKGTWTDKQYLRVQNVISDLGYDLDKPEQCDALVQAALAFSAEQEVLRTQRMASRQTASQASANDETYRAEEVSSNADPTPDEILARTEEMRQTWTQRRIVGRSRGSEPDATKHKYHGPGSH